MIEQTEQAGRPEKRTKMQTEKYRSTKVTVDDSSPPRPHRIDVIVDGEIQYEITITAAAIKVMAFGLMQQLHITPTCGNEIVISQVPSR